MVGSQGTDAAADQPIDVTAAVTADASETSPHMSLQPTDTDLSSTDLTSTKDQGSTDLTSTKDQGSTDLTSSDLTSTDEGRRREEKSRQVAAVVPDLPGDSIGRIARRNDVTPRIVKLPQADRPKR